MRGELMLIISYEAYLICHTPALGGLVLAWYGSHRV